jgi:hypothetical protein
MGYVFVDSKEDGSGKVPSNRRPDSPGGSEGYEGPTDSYDHPGDHFDRTRDTYDGPRKGYDGSRDGYDGRGTPTNGNFS